MKTLNIHTPAWLRDLPPGEYTLTDLVKASGCHKATVSRLLREYGAERRYVPVEGSHLTRVTFMWHGLGKHATTWKQAKEGIKVGL